MFLSSIFCSTESISLANSQDGLSLLHRWNFKLSQLWTVFQVILSRNELFSISRVWDCSCEEIEQMIFSLHTFIDLQSWFQAENFYRRSPRQELKYVCKAFLIGTIHVKFFSYKILKVYCPIRAGQVIKFTIFCALFQILICKPSVRV